MEKSFPSTPITVSSLGSSSILKGPSSPPVSSDPCAAPSQPQKSTASPNPRQPAESSSPPRSASPVSSAPAASGSDPQPGSVLPPAAAAPTRRTFASVAKRVIVQERLRKAEEEDAHDEEDGENIFVAAVLSR